MPADFLFVNRLPFMVAILFVCLSLSTGFPLLIPVCALSFAVMFFVEKKIFISYSRKPPIYNEKIYKIIEKCILSGLMLHCIFAIYIYGEEEIFPESISLVTVNDLVQLNLGESENGFVTDLLARFLKSPFFVILFLLTLLTLVLDLIIDGLIRSKVNHKILKNFQDSVEGDYFANFNVINYNDFPKYDFRLTDEYKILLQAWGDKKGSTGSFQKPSNFKDQEALRLVDRNQRIPRNEQKVDESQFRSIYNSSERSGYHTGSGMNNLKENFPSKFDN